MRDRKKWVAGLLAAALIVNTWTGSAWALPEQETNAQTLQQEADVQAQPEEVYPEEVQPEDTADADIPGDQTADAGVADDLTEDSAQDETGLENPADIENPVTDGGEQVADELKNNGAESVSEQVQEENTELFASEEDAAGIDISDLSFADMFVKIFGEDINASNYRIVYVADEAPANSSGDKGTQFNPYTSLAEAYQQTSVQENMIVVLEADYTIEGVVYKGYSGDDLTNGWLDDSLGRNAIIMAQGGASNGPVLKMTNDWYINGNTGFYDIKVQLAYNEKECHEIFCSGYTCVFGGVGKNNFILDRGTNNNVRFPVLFGGSDRQSVENTNVYIRGGRYTRIYTGGVGSNAVQGTARIYIDGSREDGQNIAVAIDYPNGPEVQALYGQGTVGLFNGGALDQQANVKNTVTRTFLEIANFSMGYHLYYSYGIVTDTAECELKNSKLGVVQASDTFGSVIVNIDNCEVGSFVEGNNGDVNKKVTVSMKDSTISSIQETSLIDSFEKEPFVYQMTNCKFKRLLFEYNLAINMTMDNCTQIPETTGVYYAMQYPCWANLTLKNMPQKVLFSTDSTKVSSSDQLVICLPRQCTNESQTRPAFMTKAFYGELNLENAEVIYDADEKSLKPKKIKALYLKTDGCVNIPSDCSVAVDKYEGEGTVKLGNQSSLNVADISEAAKIGLDANGEITDRITIVLQNISDDTNYIEQKEGIQDLYFVKQKVGKTTNFIYSKEQINFDGSQYIYLDGTNEGDTVYDGTSEHPVTTLEQAFNLVTSERYTIILLSDYEIEFSSNKYVFPHCPDGMDDVQVVISSRDSLVDYSAGIVFKDSGVTNGNVYMGSDISFENMEFKREKVTDYMHLRANGYRFKIGENVVTSSRMIVCGAGSSNSNIPVSKVDLQIESGTWKYIDPLSGSVGNANSVSDEVISKVTVGPDTVFEYFGLETGACYGKAQYIIEGNSIQSQGNLNFVGTYKNDLTVTVSGTWNANNYVSIGFTCEKEGKISIGESANDSILISGLFINSGTVKNEKSNQLFFGQGCQMSQFTIREDWTKNDADEKGLVKVSIDNESLKKLQLVTNKSSFATMDTFWQYVDIDLQNTKGEKQYVSIDNRLYLHSLTIGNNVSASLGENLQTDYLTVKDNGELKTVGKLEVGKENTDCLSMGKNSSIEAYKELVVNGNIDGPQLKEEAAVLKLQHKPEIPETMNTNPDGYNVIKGTVTGNLILDTDLLYEESLKSGQVLYLPKEQSDKFTLSESEKKSSLSEDDTWDIWLFGKTEKIAEYIYVSDAGNDQNEGFSAENPVQTLRTAYERVGDNGYIIVCGDLTVEEWPGNALKTAHITSYREDTAENYTTTASLILTNNTYYTSGPTYFECLHMDVRSPKVVGISSPGLPISFGISEDEMPEDSNVKNFYITGTFNSINVTGAYLETQEYFDITIHSGAFSTVTGASEVNRKRSKDEEAGKIRVTGGSISTLKTINGYMGGNAQIDLSDAKINSIVGIISTANTDPDSKIVYNITNCEVYTLYAFDQWAYNGEGQEIFHIKDCPKIDRLLLGAISPRDNTGIVFKVNVTVDIENSTVNSVQCGMNGAPELKDTGELLLNLNENAVVKALYINNITNALSTCFKKRTVSINDPSASVENILEKGINTACTTELAGVEKTHILINTREEYGGFDQITGQIPYLDIGTESASSSLQIDKALAEKVKNLSIAAGSIAYLQNGTEFPGNYCASADINNPSYLLLKNGSLIRIAGMVQGYTNIKTGTPSENGTEEFAGMKYTPHPLKNGLHIKGGEKGENVGFCMDGGEPLLESNVEWYLDDEEDNEYRNCVYVSSEGDDSSAGGYGTPVQTLAGAYKKAGELYSKIKNADADVLENSQKEELLDSMKIYVMDQVILGSFSEMKLLDEMKTDGRTVMVFSSTDAAEQGQIILDNQYSELDIPMNTQFDDVQFRSDCINKSPRIFANGYEVVFGEKVTAYLGKQEIAIYGGARTDTVEQVRLTVNGGSWNTICGGGYSGSVNGNVILKLGESAIVDAVYGGGYLQSAQTEGNITVEISGGQYNTVVGAGLNAPTSGTIALNFNEGIIENLYGGGPQSTAASGDVTVRIGMAAEGEAYLKNTLLAGGQRPVLEQVTVEVGSNAFIGEEAHPVKAFCAGGYAGTIKNTKLIINGGTFYGNIYGGGNGENSSEDYGKVTSSELYIKNGDFYGDIYGGGYNGLTELSKITLEKGNITGNIYGGGNAAAVKDTEIDMKGGKAGIVYGGSYHILREQRQIQETSSVKLSGGAADSVFGGSNLNGTISGSSSVNVPEGSSVTDVKVIYGGGNLAEITGITNISIDGNYTGDIYGGGKGELKSTNSLARAFLRIFTESDLIDAHVPATNVTINGTVHGSVFGGGEYATVGTTEEDASTEVLNAAVSKVTVAGTVDGKVYGGGKGQKDKQYAAVNGSTLVRLVSGGQVTVEGHAEDADQGVVFGGGQNAPVAGNTYVNIEDGTYSTVFGGNDVSGEIQGMAKTVFSGGTSAHVYAGGYGADTARAAVEVTGGTVAQLFGGGCAATVTESSTVTVHTTDNVEHVNTVFAGNNKAAMKIKPELVFTSGKIGTVYCGGNEGVMTYTGDGNKGIEYTFDYPGIEIETLFAGCNNTAEQTSDVQLILVSGTYGTVYGGNNENGQMAQTGVVVDASTDAGKVLTVDTIYGGGNQADARKTAVAVENGSVKTVYGGGNAATVTEEAVLKLGDAENAGTPAVTELYCGNNQAEMAICPELELTRGTIDTFYGGGNQGDMTCPKGLSYTFDAADLTIGTIFGGGNAAGADNTVSLYVKNGNYTNIYGGSNSLGTVNTSYVYIQGNVGTASSGGLTGRVYGGGRGTETRVTEAYVYLQDGTLSGNVYGGSGFGSVQKANVLAKEAENGTVKVLGNVYGAGYGVSSSADETAVEIDLGLSVKTDGTGDVQVTEQAKSSEDNSGESYAQAKWNRDYREGSYIAGNVFGGGDMGQIGNGYINVSTNTAVIEKSGTTAVAVKNGYIAGNVFGGGNGQPGGSDAQGNPITEYTVYMGTVFGSSHVTMTGGYVGGDIFGCGQQSRTYAAADETADGEKDASVVEIKADDTPILIGGSIFGGGNKGNGATQNASVATVYGDTHVTLEGRKNTDTPIYMLSNGTTGGGVYGDGNLCLVSGRKYVTLQHFSCGTRDQATLLKTFYSLQRADVVDLIGSRIVLKGAVDLVAENADDTLYSINRVGQLNLKESSTVKVTKTVNLLSELTSDEQPQRQFIDRGNNTGNAEVTGNNYTAHGGAAPAEPLTKEEEQQYIQAYESYAANGTLPTGSKFGSVNVVCVANGGYLEIKKSASAYGPVTGLFTLQLVNANPGEGGGFVYADIMGKQAGTDDADEKYVTGNFICVTKQSDSSNDYMYAYHDVGGQLASDGKYEYYLWYLRGNKYNYDVDLTAYIGTKDTDFSRTFSLSVEPDYTFVLRALQQSSSLQGIDPETLLKNTWTADEDAAGEQMAVEVTLLKNVKKGSGVEKTEEQIGFLGYETTDDTNPTAEAKKDAGGNLVWGLWRASDSDWKFQPCSGAGDTNSLPVTAGDALAQIDADVVNAQVKFTLHKGTGMTTEFRNLPFEMRILEVKQSDFDAAAKNNTYIQEDSCIRLTTNISLSAIRLVPTQAAYMGSGRMFAGVSSSSTVHVTKNSSFTAQFVTKYIPSAFNTGTSNQITETLVTGYTDIYLLDENGVGYTIAEGEDGTITLLNRVNTSDPNVKSYQIGKTEDGGYQVSYCGEDGTVLTDDDGKQRIYDCTVKTQSSGFTLPKGTVITLLASLDEDNPTYWYYYCTDATNEVKLEDFRQMNHGAADMGSSVYDTVFTTSSSRVTENMIFVFDFSNVTAADWNGELNGHVMLRHTYNSGTFQGDIMDYVSADAESTDEETAVSYTREIPKATEEFRISDGSDGVAQFTIANTDENISYGQKAQIHFMLNTVPDTTVTNTQYEEREYAVILSLQKSGDNADIPFPEGTTFLYQGQQLIVGTDNKSVIVPVGTVGKHEVELDAGLAGFAPGEYQLTAKLYATSAEGYYNSIPVGNNQGDITTSAFTIMQDPVYALKVIENSDRTKNHFAQTGESFAFAVTASGGAVSDAVDVQLYRYEKKQYVPVSTSAVLQGAPNLQTAQSGSWHPVVKDDAAKGTYRLAFTYHDKTEYWDFMITK